ncbi:hypothetical protein [Amycolatopsis azurea]|uniref:Uncharacterized protein n=1 Tax=Amycolatopsis azurea DSM 43854 TaxID=1238180 RepID=M2PGF5_9PSEU|nr:hypothetical protein [Amycolatopsis azurea]EMD23428.1 hypothetical protein C791_7254 [Amycolatopsis azurea DSM 43854]OOC04895.1 hypothetical protein B0293_20815 [Amycolatopsis azurea DSM 43854]
MPDAATSAELDIDCGFTRADSFVYTTKPETVEGLEREAEAAAEAGLPAGPPSTVMSRCCGC